MGGPITAIARPEITPVAIAAGTVSGFDFINKFGRNPDVDTASDPETIWDGGGVYTWIPTATVLKISSDDVDDDAGGAGALTVEIFGLDANYLLQNEIVTLDGQTAVNTSGIYIRIYRMIIRSAGANETATGNIYAGTGNLTTGVPANIYAKIAIGGNQTLMAIYTIPADKFGLLMGWYATINKSTTSSVADLQLLERPDGEVFQVKAHHAVVNVGSSHFFHKDVVPMKLAAKTDIKIECITVSANDLDISAGFNLMLVNN